MIDYKFDNVFLSMTIKMSR
jgi:hypothetical protein